MIAKSLSFPINTNCRIPHAELLGSEGGWARGAVPARRTQWLLQDNIRMYKSDMLAGCIPFDWWIDLGAISPAHTWFETWPSLLNQPRFKQFMAGLSVPWIHCKHCIECPDPSSTPHLMFVVPKSTWLTPIFHISGWYNTILMGRRQVKSFKMTLQTTVRASQYFDCSVFPRILPEVWQQPHPDATVGRWGVK